MGAEWLKAFNQDEFEEYKKQNNRLLNLELEFEKIDKETIRIKSDMTDTELNYILIELRIVSEDNFYSDVVIKKIEGEKTFTQVNLPKMTKKDKLEFKIKGTN